MCACQATPTYSGEALYSASCASCHGRYGEGDGPAAPALSVVMQGLRYLSARNGGVFPRDTVERLIDGRERRAAHGGDMPIWGEVYQILEGDVAGTEGRVAARVSALTDHLERMQVLK
jgi:mono/diheme cytochrome c family protein